MHLQMHVFTYNLSVVCRKVVLTNKKPVFRPLFLLSVCAVCALMQSGGAGYRARLYLQYINIYN